jgi:hypothetical protein
VKSIFVGNLDFNTSEEDVRELFAAYGQVDRVTIDGTLLGDRALNVNEARPRPGRAGGGRESRERRRSGGRW